MMIQRKDTPVMYLQDAQNLFNEDAEYGNWELTKAAVMSEYKIEKSSNRH
jgi:hypothetical protein